MIVAFRLVLGASLLAVTTTFAPAAAPTVPNFPAAWLARAKAKGIDPSDPSLAAKLSSLAQAHRSELKSRLLTGTPLKATELLQFKALDPGIAASIRNATVARNLGGPLGVAAPPVIDSLTQFSNQVGTITVPAVKLVGSNFIDPASDTHVYVDTTCGLYDFQKGRFYTNTATELELDLWYFVDKPQTAKLWVQDGQGASAKKDVSLGVFSGCGLSGCNGPEASIDDTGFPECYEFSACAPGKDMFLSPNSRLSTNPLDGKTEGDDVLAYTSAELNGFQFTPQIGYISSDMDPPGTAMTNNVYRGATITQAPSGGRMETKVHWYHLGGESISYLVTWQYTGTTNTANAAFREKTSDSKRTTCPSEQ